MLLLFRSGWFHSIFGAAFLSAGIVLLGDENNPFGLFSSLVRPALWAPTVIPWILAGVLGHVSILAVFTLVGILAIPDRFLRWWFSSLSRIYGNMSVPRALSLSLMAALLIEPLLRLGLQPLLIRELEPISAIFVLAGIVAAASWSPFTNLLAVATFFESLLFSFIYAESNNPIAPVIAHGISEFMIAVSVGKLTGMGFTREAPPTPS